MARQQVTGERHWYVLHTYSGYEDSVALNVKQRIESMGMQDRIFDALVPKEKKIKIKDGKRITIEEKIVPGYVGSGTTPTPVADEEWEFLKKRMGADEPKFKVEFQMGDLVKVTDGPFKEYEGKVGNVDEQHGKVKVMVTIFGRETPVELVSLQEKKIWFFFPGCLKKKKWGPRL